MDIPLLSIPVAYLLIYMPKIPLSIAMAKAGGYDNHNPREQQDKLTGYGARARAAHMNGFESFPGFAAAAVIAHMVHANPTIAAALCITHVAARTVYPFLYLSNIAALRSLVWGLGFLATLGLFAISLAA